MIKTAMQLHLEDLEQALNVCKPLKIEGVVSALESAIDSAKHYLIKEKEQIKFAFDQGQNGEFYSPEKYFNETFDQSTKVK